MAAAAMMITMSVPLKRFIVSSMRWRSWQRGAISCSVVVRGNLHNRKYETNPTSRDHDFENGPASRKEFSDPDQRSVGIGPEVRLDVSGVMVDDDRSWILDLEDLKLHDERLPRERMVVIQHGRRV